MQNAVTAARAYSSNVDAQVRADLAIRDRSLQMAATNTMHSRSSCLTLLAQQRDMRVYVCVCVGGGGGSSNLPAQRATFYSGCTQVDKAMVNVGALLAEQVSGRVSTEIDPRLAHDTGACGA